MIRNKNQAAITKAAQHLDLYWDCILDMAYNHNKNASRIVLNHLRQPGYKDFIKNVHSDPNGFDPGIIKDTDKNIEQDKSEAQEARIRPIDFAKEHGLKTDSVMRLLREAGVKVPPVVDHVTVS